MAMIKCPECGKEKISNTADVCPDCGYSFKKVKKKRNRKIFTIILLIICGIFMIKNTIDGIEEKRINNLLQQVEKHYADMDLLKVQECCDILDELNYDTTDIRENVNYDIENYEVALKFRNALNNAFNKIDIDTVENLTEDEFFEILDEMNDIMQEFTSASGVNVNKKSNVGNYFKEMRNNVFYDTLWNDVLVKRATVAYNNHIANAIQVKVILEQLLEIEFPYMNE